MEYRILGKSKLKVSAVAFGAWAIGGWMWGGTDVNQSVDAIREAYENGITTIDTAPVYGFGLSEEIVSMATKGIRDKVQIFTKFGVIWDDKIGEPHQNTKDNYGNPIETFRYASKNSIIKECEQSLKRLNSDYIDLFQIHWPNSVNAAEEIAEGLLILKEQGKILEAGVCNYSKELLQDSIQIIPLISNQVPYSMINRGIEKDLIPYSITKNISTIAYSPLQRGLLTGKVSLNYTFKDNDHRSNNKFFRHKNREIILDFLEKIKPVAGSYSATLSQLVINWTLRQPGITIVLVGARSKGQAKENSMSCNFKISDEDLKFINNLLNDLNIDLK